MIELKEIQKKTRAIADIEQAEHHQRYFKTAEGEYGAGDIFLGLKVPETRNLAKLFKNTTLSTLTELLKSKYHEERQLALFILVLQCKSKKTDIETKKQIFELYLNNTKYVNNWDLVDCSAEHIVGAYLFDKSKDVLYRLAESDSLWERRISIMSTFYFIRQNMFEDTLKLASVLLQDKEDLIHKAVGWMLREVGNRNKSTEEVFLKKYYKSMPRTMLRYAIEKFPNALRQEYLKGSI